MITVDQQLRLRSLICIKYCDGTYTNIYVPDNTLKLKNLSQLYNSSRFALSQQLRKIPLLAVKAPCLRSAWMWVKLKSKETISCSACLVLFWHQPFVITCVPFSPSNFLWMCHVFPWIDPLFQSTFAGSSCYQLVWSNHASLSVW